MTKKSDPGKTLDRRSFLKTGGNVVFPALAVLGLALTAPLPARADCHDSCTFGCTGSCQNTCKDTCEGRCEGVCENNCTGTCEGCSNTCVGGSCTACTDKSD